MYLEDTIVAAATPPGRGAIAIVRLSGRNALPIVDALWRPLKDSQRRVSALRLGEILDPATGATLDQAMCAIFRAPHSATGEDVAELHCHGGPYLVRRIIGLAAERGARIAEPGEFTRRAYLNGRIDLTVAEAIADLIDARGEGALTQAASQLGGALAACVESLRGRLIGIRAHLEAAIDFADEDLELLTYDALCADIDQLAAEIEALHDTFERGRLARDGVRVTIIGKPNAGKSSVLNLLLGAERAIVTAIPGTTRDIIEDTVSLGPFAMVMRDTAGLRTSGDEVERIGIERAEKSAAEADLLIAVFDGARPLDVDDARTLALAATRPGVALLNKSDLPSALSSAGLCAAGCALPIIDFSATTGAGLAQLRIQLLDSVERLSHGAAPGDSIVISRERHRAALAQALEALAAARTSLRATLPPELVALDLSMAAEALAALTGAISTEDILDAVFREFCIGK